MKTLVLKTNFKKYLLIAVAGIQFLFTTAQSGAPELVFKNPVLKSGTANKQGAVYRFANVTSGVDAEIKLRKFSRNDIVMETIDKSDMGWDKAFQPQFGLPGWVQARQEWYVDFELVFYKAGTTTRQQMDKVDLTALDVDGDGVSVSEYCIFDRPKSIAYSTVSYLSNAVSGLLSQSFVCAVDGISCTLKTCSKCGGDGLTNSGSGNNNECADCDGSGMLHSLCNHAFQGVSGSLVQGPVENFMNIDTLATQVMATYQYENTSTIRFRYGAKSGSQRVYGSGIRLNSTWFRQFSLAPANTLPVKLTSFTATYNKKDVTLNWTGVEENFSHYIVQRSTDGQNFSDIAIVFANINSSVSTYNYKDANVSSATSTLFYRLQMVDKGQERGELSETRVIRLSANNETLKIAAYPNPVTDQLKITLPASWQGKAVAIQLYNANGVLMQEMQMGSASQTESIQIGKIPKGVYLIKAMSNGEVAKQQIIKN